MLVEMQAQTQIEAVLNFTLPQNVPNMSGPNCCRLHRECVTVLHLL